ncbi:hypothetical protein C8J56DRAFT_915439 [Mycena floridula]|nr:hypothetical protein C8J56DRAFT_915439 [Mycena floridula]
MFLLFFDVLVPLIMASGYSFTGGPSRCFSYWQEFSKCYAQADSPRECVLQSEDYLECLHGTKKAARDKMIHDELVRQMKNEAAEGRKSASVASVGVGLIQKAVSDETK